MSREPGISIPGKAQGFHIQSRECSWGVSAGGQGSDLPQAQSSVTEASVPTPWLIAVPQVWRAVSSAGPHAYTHSPAPCAFSCRSRTGSPCPDRVAGSGGYPQPSQCGDQHYEEPASIR